MNALEKEIRSRIQIDGPLSIAEFMVFCLNHPQHGYYTTSTPVGGRKSTAQSGGDFITAPEISQLFGEMIGVWCMEMWQSLGSPEKFNLVEIGPGRGTLMRDLLRISNALPDFQKAADIHLIEISPTLREQQNQLLSDISEPKWILDIEQLPEALTIIIANELLDALPFRQWVKHEGEWFERAIGEIDRELTFVLRPNKLPELELPADHNNEPEGSVFETSPAREGFIAKTADWIAQHHGTALFIDYGHTKSGFGDTFQAMKNHAFSDPLRDLGTSDLTSHVDFAPLVAAAHQSGCYTSPPTTQGKFLLSLGLLERAGSLGRKKSQDVQINIKSSVERLASGDQMGELFKVMAFGASKNPIDRWLGFSED